MIYFTRIFSCSSGSDGESGHGSEYLHSLYQHVKALSCLVHGEAVDKFGKELYEF